MSLANTYGLAATRKQLPRLAHLLASGHEGRPTMLRLPAWTTTYWQFAVLCAAVDQLHRRGLTRIEIARRFGWTSRGPNMVAALLEVAATMSRKAARGDWWIASRWPRAVVESGPYSRA